MESIIEYSGICDLVVEVSKLNLENTKILEKQREFVESLKMKTIKPEEIKKKTLYFQDEYNDIDSILTLDMMYYSLPLSEYLTPLLH